MKSLWNSKKTPSLFSTFPYQATSANQPLLSSLVQLQQPQSLKIWAPKCSDTWNTQNIDVKLNIVSFSYFFSIWDFWIRDIFPSFNVFCVSTLDMG